MISRRQFLRGRFSAPVAASSAASDGPQLAHIESRCVAFADVVCRSCGDACGEAAIRFSPRIGGAALPAVIADKCTGCGECVVTCPANAIILVPAPRPA